MSSTTENQLRQSSTAASGIDNLSASKRDAPTSASSFTTSTLSTMSFSEQGGTLKKNLHGKSDVWQFFQIYDEVKYTTHAFCALCKCDVNYGKSHSTSNLEKHIRRHHKEEYDNILSE